MHYLRPAYTREKMERRGTIFTCKQHRSVPKRVHICRRLWSSFGTERIIIGSEPNFAFACKRSTSIIFGTDLPHFFPASSIGMEYIATSKRFHPFLVFLKSRSNPFFFARVNGPLIFTLNTCVSLPVVLWVTLVLFSKFKTIRLASHNCRYTYPSFSFTPKYISVLR